MPLYTYICTCGLTAEHVVTKSEDEVRCTCGETMLQKFPGTLHTKIGASLDSTDPGKVTRQKNEALKKKWSGYKHEEQNLRNKITSMVNNRLHNKVD